MPPPIAASGDVKLYSNEVAAKEAHLKQLATTNSETRDLTVCDVRACKRAQRQMPRFGHCIH